MPSDAVLYERLFRSMEEADALGYRRAWVGEAHYSLAPEQVGPNPFLPHFKGELCINTDILLGERGRARMAGNGWGSAVHVHGGLTRVTGKTKDGIHALGFTVFPRKVQL